jgi:choline monooxygenase
MSDLSVNLDALARSQSQLSVSSYFDAGLFEREMATIVRAGPRYLGARPRRLPDPGAGR